MKLVRWGAPGAEKPGVIDKAGAVRDLSGVVADLDAAALSPEGLKRLAAVDPESLPKAPVGARLGPPVAFVSKIVAVGLNYADHAAESGNPIPSEPVLFMKAVSSLNGPNDDVIIPKNSVKTDWEVELAVVIGTRASYVEEKDALDHVAGYCVANDVSEREFQIERGPTWDKGKGCDTFCPLGPWLVTRDEVPDPQNLNMFLDVNGHRFQDGNTKTMIFSVAHLVHYISHFMTLLPGDVIVTGTPPGVGLGKKPPIFLKPGDVMDVGVEGLGSQRQNLRAWTAG
jgi:2-keto-4-pentenoate hydratase/2-oxohepta-3-ene-1,7-dioic acid hydratase in catechol pathway